MIIDGENDSTPVQATVMALGDIDTELHEPAQTVHGIKDLLIAQNRDVHRLAIKKLVFGETIDHDLLPEDVSELREISPKTFQSGYLNEMVDYINLKPFP